MRFLFLLGLIALSSAQLVPSIPVSCAQCKEAVHAVEKVITDQGWRNDVKGVITKICDALTPQSEYKKQCESIVNELPKLFKELEKELPEACSDLGVCSSQEFMTKLGIFSISCDVCNEAVDVVKFFLSQKAVQDELKGFLDTACAVIPEKALADACKETVNEFLPEIIDYINNDLLANLCKDILNCGGFKSMAARDFSICDTLQAIYDAIPKIIGEAEGVCDKIPVTELKQACHEAFNKYKAEIIEMGHEAVKWLADHIPFVHCNIGQELTFKGTSNLGVLSIGCDVCNEAVNVIKFFLEQKAVQDELKVYLDQACSVLPEKALADACKETVNEYLPEIIDYVDKDILANLCKDILNCGGLKSLAARDFSICDTLQAIYDAIPKIIGEAEGVCDKIPVTELKQACHEAFDKYKAQIIEIGHEAVKWLADHIPFVHCKIGF